MESASSDVSLQLALRKFEKAAELAPQWSEVHYYLGVARNVMNDFRAAVQSFNRYLELAPEAADAETVRDLIRQIETKQQNASSPLPGGASATVKPGDPAGLGNEALHRQQYDQAVAYYLKALEANPADFRSSYNLGVCYVHLNKTPLAIEAFRKAVQLNPAYHLALNDLGLVYAKLSRFQEALDAYTKANTAKPDYAPAYYNAGDRAQTARPAG